MNMPRPSQLVWMALIAAIAPTVSSVAALVVAMHGAAQVTAVAEKVESVAAKVEIVHKATNSMKDALVASTRKESLQEGKIAGAKEGHAAGIKEEKSRHFFK